MKLAAIPAFALVLGGCTPVTDAQPRMGGLPEDFPRTILTDLRESDRAGVEEIIAFQSSGLVGYCSEDEIAAALAVPMIMTWFGYADTVSAASVAYIEANQADLAARYAALADRCRQRLIALAEQAME